MIVAEIANSHNDEYYTPQYAIDPIVKYIRPNSTIWCPFDTEQSLFKSILETAGHNVICTHINHGEDFFTTALPKCDYIISNPPYSKKGKVLERLFELKIPFAMLVGVIGLFESKQRFDMFRDNEFEIMYFNKRISYFKDYADNRPSINPPFSSVYVCHKMLPKQIVFEEITKTTKSKN